MVINNNVTVYTLRSALVRAGLPKTRQLLSGPELERAAYRNGVKRLKRAALGLLGRSRVLTEQQMLDAIVKSEIASDKEEARTATLFLSNFRGVYGQH